MKIIVLLALICNVIIAQNKSLVGTWKYEKLIPKQEKDAHTAKIMDKALTDMQYKFTEKRFQLTLGNRKEFGEYILDNGEITFIREDSFLEEKRLISKLDNNSFLLSLEHRGDIQFVKTSAELPKLPERDIRNGVPATIEQIAKKWKIYKVNDFENKEPHKLTSDSLKDENWFASREFKKDETYKTISKEHLHDGDGTWEFGTDNKSILIDKKSYDRYEIYRSLFIILYISEDRMILMDWQKEIWYYKAL